MPGFDHSPVETLKPEGLGILAERMLRIQGYTQPERVRPAVRRAAEHAAITMEQLVDPDVRYRRVAVEACTTEALQLAGGTALHCPAFARFLGSCPVVVVFLLTAGARVDEELDRLNDDGQLLEMLFLETAGWLAVEEITKAFAMHLRTAAREKGMKITRRMGPGYSYTSRQGEAMWPLEEQRHLFALLDDGNLPVDMLESCAMKPKMSRSGLIGMAPDQRQ